MKLRDYQKEAVSKYFNGIRSAKDGENGDVLVLPTGCHAKDTEILMYDGSLKMVQDIKVGDLLMGEDSKPKTVLNLARGRETMYKIIPIKGESFIVNESHILHLYRTKDKGWFEHNARVNITVKDYLNKSKYFKHIHKLIKTGVEFNNFENVEIKFPAYELGLLLGDGCFTQKKVNLTSGDSELIELMADFFKSNGDNVRITHNRNHSNVFAKNVENKGTSNTFKLLCQLGLSDKRSSDKFIPQEYLTHSRETRLNLLAGLIDSDGFITKGHIDYITKSKFLGKQVAFLARSLGLSVRHATCIKGYGKHFKAEYQRLGITGNTNEIPFRRKVHLDKVQERKQIKNHLVGQFNLEKLQEDDFYGFELDGNHLYLTGDFTIHHNTGKSICIASIVGRLLLNQPYLKILVLSHVKELIQQNFEKLQLLYPQVPMGICCSGLKLNDTKSNAIFGTISTVFKRLPDIGKVDLVIIDECHRVSLEPKSLYYKLIESLREIKPDMRLLGLTATPYRAKQGLLTEGDKPLFQRIVCDMSSGDTFLKFIEDGYLSKISTKSPSVEVDVSNVAITGGDFNGKQLDAATNQDDITRKAVSDMVSRGFDRYCWLIFAVSVEHCENIVSELGGQGITAKAVHSKMSESERDAAIKWSKVQDGSIKAIVNVGVLTTGYDNPQIDLMGIIRPTKSVSLWVQIVGRGMRPVYSEGYDLSKTEGRLSSIANGAKSDGCLILDYAGNTKRLGAVNGITPPASGRKKKGGPAIMKTCPECDEIVHSAVRFCPSCNHKFEFKSKITEFADTKSSIIKGKSGELKNAPQHVWFDVETVSYSLHTNKGNSMIKVTYNTGLSAMCRSFNEYVCLNHTGYARHKAIKWVTERLPQGSTDDEHKALCHSVESCLKLIHKLKKPKRIEVWVNQKYPTITNCLYNTIPKH